MCVVCANLMIVMAKWATFEEIPGFLQPAWEFVSFPELQGSYIRKKTVDKNAYRF